MSDLPPSAFPKTVSNIISGTVASEDSVLTSEITPVTNHWVSARAKTLDSIPAF